MKATVLIRVATRSILRNKLRSLLTMLGIIIGVSAVIVMVALGKGAQAQVRERIESLGTNMIIVTPGASRPGGVSQGAQSFNRLKLEDAERIARQGYLVSEVAPVIVTRAQVVGGEGNWRAAVFGVSTEYEAIRNWSTESGLFFQEQDVRSRRKVAVLGRTVSDALFPGQDPVGQQIRLRDVPFRIVGVLARKGQTAEGTDQDDVVLAPYTTVNSRLAGRQFIAQIIASTRSPEEIPEAQEELRGILRESHGLATWEDDDFTIKNQKDLAAAAEGTTEVMRMLLSAIAGVSLVVGGIGIMNIMLVSVTERTREIGLRLAVGARASDVMTQFLVESVVLSIVGGVLGTAVGAVASGVLGGITGWAIVISPDTLALAVGFSGAVGIFFGFHPARKAASLNPIEALRHE